MKKYAISITMKKWSHQLFTFNKKIMMLPMSFLDH